MVFLVLFFGFVLLTGLGEGKYIHDYKIQNEGQSS